MNNIFLLASKTKSTALFDPKAYTLSGKKNTISLASVSATDDNVGPWINVVYLVYSFINGRIL